MTAIRKTTRKPSRKAAPYGDVVSAHARWLRENPRAVGYVANGYYGDKVERVLRAAGVTNEIRRVSV